MRISDWSSDVCSSDLAAPLPRPALRLEIDDDVQVTDPGVAEAILRLVQEALTNSARHADADVVHVRLARDRSEEHTSALQSLMCISYAVFCLKKTNKNKHQNIQR